LLKTIRIKKPGGGTRLQKVKVLASGKYKFVKNTTKGMIRKTRPVGRRAYEKVKKKVKRRSSRSKSKSNKPRKKSEGMKMPKLGKTITKIAKGVGLATLAAIPVAIFAPQILPIAKPVAAFIGGGWEGAVGEIIIDQGIVQHLMQMVGGSQPSGSGVQGL
jgi:predicted class III extradiol MEMO1 family dioxygenase